MIFFPYRKYKDREGNYVHLPIVSARVKCNGVLIPIWALVDSGADVTLLNFSFAQLFKINLKRGKKIELVGVMEGAPFFAYVHQVNLSIKDVGSVNTVVAFTESEQYPEHMILGRRGFFEHFIIRFEEYRKHFGLELVRPNPPSFASAPVPPFLQ